MSHLNLTILFPLRVLYAQKHCGSPTSNCIKIVMPSENPPRTKLMCASGGGFGASAVQPQLLKIYQAINSNLVRSFCDLETTHMESDNQVKVCLVIAKCRQKRLLDISCFMQL